MRVQLPGRSLKRLFGYYREITRLAAEGKSLVSSAHLACVMAIKSTQVRKDLNYLGGFGKRGVGYPIDTLRRELRQVLRLERKWNVALAGLGNLGRALLNYSAFYENGYVIKAVFEKSPDLVGSTINEVPVLSIDDLAEEVKKRDITLMIVAVPANSAQEVVDQACEAGIVGILNFAPAPVYAPDDIWLRSVDLTEQLNVLAFRMEHSPKSDDC